VIFEADSRAGRVFDLVLIGLILASLVVVMLSSITSVHARWAPVFTVLEWSFTLSFTAEYIARLSCMLRLLRLFRILKLGAYVHGFAMLGRALMASRRKILVFMSFVLMVVTIMGTLMSVVEGPEHGFTSIPVGVYWAITTMTTVGFGDITPKTDLGRMIASVMMLLGWGTLAVPTGIVNAEFTAQRMGTAPTTRTCHECLS
jgi:voltage-gated potassium channel